MSKSPDAFRTISEVADWLGVQAHVLRFWESKFTQLKPVKRAGGRRYYRPADMLLLGGIRKLLHEDGLPIKEVQALLRDMGVAHVSAMSHALDGEVDTPPLAPAPAAETTAPEATAPEAAMLPTADTAPPPVPAQEPPQAPMAQAPQEPPVAAEAAPARPVADPPQAPVAQPTPAPDADPLPPADMLADDWQGSLELADEAAPLESSENVLGFPQADPVMPPAADIAETPLFAAAPPEVDPDEDVPALSADAPTADVAPDSPVEPDAEDTLVAAAGLQPEQALDFSVPAPEQPAPMETSPDAPAPADSLAAHPDPAPYPPHDLDEAARQLDALEYSGGFAPAADAGSETPEQQDDVIGADAPTEAPFESPAEAPFESPAEAPVDSSVEAPVESSIEAPVAPPVAPPDELTAPVEDPAPIAGAEPPLDTWEPAADQVDAIEPEPAELPPARLPPLAAAAPPTAAATTPSAIESQSLFSSDQPETGATFKAHEPEADPAPFDADADADSIAPPESFGDSPALTPLIGADTDIAAETAPAPLPEVAISPENVTEDSQEPDAPETTAVDAAPQALRPGVLAHLAGLKQLPPQSQDAIRACATELRALLHHG